MGARNVSAAFTFWSTSLNHAPFRLLVSMSLTSMDCDEPRYWGGRDDLAHALGRRVPSEPDPSDESEPAVVARRARNAAFTAVRAALQELKSLGVVEQVRTGRPGVNSEYRLHLMAQGQPTPAVQAEPTDGAGSAYRMAQAQPAPEEQQQEDRRTIRKTSPEVTNLRSAVDNVRITA